MQPRLTSRTDRLIVREVADETVVYDLASEQVTALDAVTASVWRAASAGATVEDIAGATGLAMDAVAAAVVRLADADLIVRDGFSRRQLMARAGTVAAVGTLASIASPAVAFATSTPANVSIYQTGCTVNTGGTSSNISVSLTASGLTPAAQYQFQMAYTNSTGQATTIKSPTGSGTVAADANGRLTRADTVTSAPRGAISVTVTLKTGSPPNTTVTSRTFTLQGC